MKLTSRKTLTATACLCLVALAVAFGWLGPGSNSRFHWVGWQRSHVRLANHTMSVTYGDTRGTELVAYWQIGPVLLMRGPSKQTLDQIGTELDVAGLYNSAIRASGAGNVRRAEAIYRKVIARYPNDRLCYEALGDLLASQKRYQEAKTNYLDALKLNSQSVDALYGLGYVAYSLDRSTEAKIYLERALLLDPQNGLCHRLMGFVAERLGDTRSAAGYYERAIALDPSAAGDGTVRKRLEELKR